MAGYDVASWNALATPAGTPPDVLDRLGRAIRDAVATTSRRDRMARLGMRMQVSSPAGMRALLVAEANRWGAVIRAARIEPE